jgi:hypothetical protein
VRQMCAKESVHPEDREPVGHALPLASRLIAWAITSLARGRLIAVSAAGAGLAALGEAADHRAGILAACPAPLAELRHIHAAVPGLAVVDPGLRLPQFLTELTLRQASLVPQLPQEGGKTRVASGVLGLGRHWRHRIPVRKLDTSCVSAHTAGARSEVFA